MELEKVTAVIRPRAPWEAVDLGFRMVLSDARRVYTVLGLFMLPLYAAIIAVAAFAGMIEAAMPVLWWLKPMFDRVVLGLSSRSLFGDQPGVRHSLRQSLRVAFGAGLVQALTLYRLDPARSLNLPVWQLEQLRGRRRWQRARILHRETWGVATLLTLFCSSLEAVAMVSVFAVIGLMIPPELDIGMIHWAHYFIADGGTLPFTLLYITVYGCAVWLIEPLFVGGGFALYLNRRTLLEAWDIELAFRRLAARHGKAPLAAAVLVLLWLPAALVAPAPARAQDATDDPQALIEQVLAHPDFQDYETVRQWEPHYLRERIDNDDSVSEAEWVLSAMARGGEIAVWLLVLGVAVLLWVRRDWLRSFFRPEPEPDKPRSQPPPRHATVLAAPGLPADIPAAVQALWNEERFIDAASLLYRGAIRELAARYKLSLGDNATERDWLTAAQRHCPDAVAGFFGAITRAWQTAAYAQRAPAPDRLLALCRQWPEAFGERP